MKKTTRGCGAGASVLAARAVLSSIAASRTSAFALAACLIKRGGGVQRGRDAHLIRYYVSGASELGSLFVMLSSDASIPIELNCG